MKTASPLRCAIYTRVSTEHGLEKEFNSLDNQREAAEAYVKSQAHEGWRCLSGRYDDGSFSGGSLERPALQRLLAEIQAKRIDIVVVYKVDRLTRSLADFAKLVELFDAHGVSFVSVTQAFNTTNSMGRLTLNVLLSFAQFEREVTGERIRDKIAASKQKGIWMGGVVPLGYRAENRALHIVEEHAEVIRSIYDRYRALGSVARLSEELDRADTRIPLRIDGTGKQTGGSRFSRGHLFAILSNPIYAGQIRHKGRVHAGQHPPIIDPRLWDEVQTCLKGRGSAHRHHAIAVEHILTGRIRDDAGQPMSPTHTSKGSKRYRYYVSGSLQQGRSSGASIRRIAASEVEAAISKAIASATGADIDGRALVEQHLRQVTVRPDMLEIELSDDRLLQIDWTQTPSRRRREIVVPADASPAVRPMKVEDRDRILKAIGQGRAWLVELTDGLVASPDVIASREAVSDRTVRNTIAMALLSPTIVSAIVDGRLPRGIGIARLAELPAAWSAQHAMLGI
jgi:DNA invertase Pin-like site-specific DNA recombinase